MACPLIIIQQFQTTITGIQQLVVVIGAVFKDKLLIVMKMLSIKNLIVSTQ